MLKTFYDWCIENNRNDLLERWDCDLNSVSPKDIGYKASIKIYFKCPNGLHSSELKPIHHIAERNQSVDCNQCNSFEQFCIENNEIGLLKRWDYDLNKCSPLDVNRGTVKKYYFKCPNGIHESELKCINNFTNKYKQQYGSMDCSRCNSFAQWGIDNICEDFLERYWDYKKNVVNPWNVSKSCKTVIFIKCQEKEYHESYKTNTNEFYNGKRCPYCAGRQVNKFDSLGYLYPDVFDIWSDKNTRSPYDYTPRSFQKVWFKCKDGLHEDYQRNLDHSFHLDFRCPSCSKERGESILEEKVRLYLNIRYQTLHEFNCNIIPVNPETGHKMPFDNEVADLKLIIEVHGMQHYRITNLHNLSAKKFNTTPEFEFNKIKQHDKFKKEFVISNGYYYLEIPYTSDNKKESYKKLIDNKINEILESSLLIQQTA